jgi:serine/threonine-protein kinase HipA
MSSISVYYEVRVVGRIETGTDGPSFVYEPGWLRTRGAFPLSITMPLSPHPVPPQTFLPWATNLLPEGTQLKTISTMLGAAIGDTIAILRQIGRDTSGALSIDKPGERSAEDWKPVTKPAQLERIIEELPSKPFLAGDDGVSMSLAGVQTKLAVAVNEMGKICIPLNGSPSTHILKPDSERLHGSVQNEALCLTLARRCGLRVPGVTTGKAGKRSYILVERYDRLRQGEHWRRLHQEDFCQALGKPPSAKYESNQTGIKGPTLVDMFALTRNAMRAPDILALLDLVIFNIIACNTDAHAKNYSILISGQGFRLAPVYDVLCATAWPGITANLAQRIAGKNRGDHLEWRHWERFALECGLNPKRVVERVADLTNLAASQVVEAGREVAAMPAGTHVMLGDFQAAIEARTRRMLSGLSREQRQRPSGTA